MVTYRDLFEYLEKRLTGGDPCDTTFRLTREFAEQHRLSFSRLFRVLGGWAGFLRLRGVVERCRAHYG